MDDDFKNDYDNYDFFEYSNFFGDTYNYIEDLSGIITDNNYKYDDVFESIDISSNGKILSLPFHSFLFVLIAIIKNVGLQF